MCCHQMSDLILIVRRSVTKYCPYANECRQSASGVFSLKLHATTVSMSHSKQRVDCLTLGHKLCKNTMSVPEQRHTQSSWLILCA